MDTKLVPNYRSVITTPMDFGTMTTKVEKGRYRSIEQFNVGALLS